jgi:hypothetical protein
MQDEAPKPMDDVALAEIPEQLVFVQPFGGIATGTTITKRAFALMDKLLDLKFDIEVR